MLDKTFTDAMETYAQHIIDDYDVWKNNSKENMIVTFEEGSKYIRVVCTYYGSRGAHSFIVKKHPTWPLGTLLMCASWKAPAQNFSRGNIFDKESYIKRARWTGIS